MLGQVTNGKNLTIPDMNFREIATFLPLIAWAIWIGVYPKPYFDILQRPVADIVERVRPGYFNGPMHLAEANRSLARQSASTVAAPKGGGQ
jgi:NADH-quinone oxidoreductase subunit M